MKPWGQFAIVFIAYAMALIHTGIPHQHVTATDGRMTVTTIHCGNTSSVEGLLEMVFSTNLGYGHLETFQQNVGIDNVSQFVVLIFLISTLFVLVIKSDIPATLHTMISGVIGKLHKLHLLFSSAGFRAPPVIA